MPTDTPPAAPATVDDIARLMHIAGNYHIRQTCVGLLPATIWETTANEFREAVGALVQRAESAERERDIMRKIIDKLPKTADAVTIIDGMQVFPPCGHAPFIASLIAERHACFTDNCYTNLPNGDSSGRSYSPTECYSTREAALAASVGGTKETKR